MSNSIPNTGEIKWSVLRDTFGGSNPVRISDYYTSSASGLTTGVTGLPSNNSQPFQLSTFRGKSKAAPVVIYQIPTFTSCGASYNAGPTTAQMQATYSNLYNTIITRGNFDGYQVLTVQETGTYQITCYGAQGGSWNIAGYGSGAIMQGSFNLTAGQKLIIIVGQAGANGGQPVGSGGGGSFVVDAASSNVPMICAGGGGGGGCTPSENFVAYSSTGVQYPPATSSATGGYQPGSGFTAAGGGGTFSTGFGGSTGYGVGGFGGGGAGGNSSGSRYGGGGGGFSGGYFCYGGTSYINTAICSSYSNLGTWTGNGKVTIVKQ